MLNLFYYFLILITFFACNKLNLCNDKELSFERMENNTNALYLIGYYYGDLIGSNPEYPGIHIFYKNGIYYYNSQKPFNEAKEGGIVLNNRDTRLNSKSNWGVYKIKRDSIEIQSWLPTKNCHHVQIQKGVIENDSTFRITSYYSTESKEAVSVSSEFKFVEYSPNPDSVVSFIP